MVFLVSLSPSLSWSWLLQSSENSKTAEQLNGEERRNCAKKKQGNPHWTVTLKNITLTTTRDKTCHAGNNKTKHSISERFVLQKGYRMNHCQVTLNTDQTLKQRTASDRESIQKFATIREFQIHKRENKNILHTYWRFHRTARLRLKNSAASHSLSCYYKPNHIGVD